MNDPAMLPKPQDSPEYQTGVGCVARFVRPLLLWLARCHPKNQTADNIGYPQLWYCWPRWMKRKWGPFGGPKQKGLHRILTGTCGLLTGHEWSKTEIGYSGCGVDRWCRWCDKVVTMPLCESPLPPELKDIAKGYSR